MSPAPNVIVSRGSWWRWPTRVLRWTVGALLLAWSLLLAAWLILTWGILPHIDEWRPRIEALASRELGAPVTIGAIQAHAGGWVPAAELRDVVIRDGGGREALRLPRVSAALSVPSLLALQLRFDQLLIDGAELVVRRDPQGRISVGGLEMAGRAGVDAEAGSPAVDWFFEQHEFVIRDATLTWIDEQRAAPPLQLTDTVVVVRNRLRRHELRIDATPQATWGDRFSLRARLSQPIVARSGDWRRWRGTVYADLPLVDVALMRQYVALPFELREGRGALRTWIELRDGEPGAATVDLALRDVALRLAQDLQPLQFEHLRARLEGERGAQRARVAVRGLEFATTDGIAWAASNFDASWRSAGAAGAEAISGGEFNANRLDLAAMASIASRLPLGDALRKLLAELAPRGTVGDLAARWDGPLDAPRHYQARAHIKGLSIAAAPAAQGVGRPGFVNADIELLASELGGDARLAMANGAFEFPGVFEQPVVPLRKFDAQLAWRIGAPGDGAAAQRPVDLQVKQARFENDDAHGELTLGWKTGAGAGFGRGGRFPGLLDLHGEFADAPAARVARYLPLGLPRNAREYVQRAVQAGTIGAARFDVQGDLWDFPFHDPKVARDAVFRIAGRVKDATFAYVPSVPAGADEPAYVSPWPAITQAAGEVVFERGSMRIRQAQGRIFGVDLRGVDATIADLSHERVLEIGGQARGPLADMLRYVNATPLGEPLAALAQASTSGDADLRLDLRLPLAQLQQTTVRGAVQLAGNDVRLRANVPLLAQTRGRVDFTEQGLRIVGARARALGGELGFDGGTQPDGSLRFAGQGSASADGLRREFDAASRWMAALQGQAAYRLQLGFVRGQPELLLTSNLAGMAIDLPAPLAKTADAAWPLRVQTVLQAPPSAVAAAGPRDLLRVELGSVLQAQYLRERAPEGARVLRGAVGINQPAPPAIVGGQAVADLGSGVSIDAWRTLLAGADGAAGAAAETSPFAGYLPQRITLRAGDLLLMGRRFTGNTVELQRTLRDGGAWWHAAVQSDQLAGTLDLREPRAADAGQLNARLARLWLPPVEAVAATGGDRSSPASLPSMDVTIDDLRWRDHPLGRAELVAAGRGDAALAPGSDWRLQRLVLRAPDATFSGSGQSGPAAGGQRRMAMDFELDLADSGAFLERLGFGKTLDGGKGKVRGRLGWAGSPLAPDLPSLDGQLTLALESGRFLKADAGAARLLGVLSLQALPRRLLLDFRDVLEDGFAFDSVDGDVRLAAGVADIASLRMRGVQATVLLDGKADLVRETQDLRMFVVPEINAGAASLAYAAINPAIGLGTFVAQWLLRRPLIAANTREFHITGSWERPLTERVESKPGEAAAPGSAPSAPQ